MRDMMFEAPSDDTIQEIIIHESTINENTEPEIIRSDEKIA